VTTPASELNRRDFLRAGTCAAAGVALGFPRQASWAAETPGPAVRIACFTDVHARTEWNTPRALGQCAEAINRQRPDVVLACGDLVTDGITSAPGGIDARWDAYVSHLHRRIEAPLHAAIGNHDYVGVAPADGSASAPDPRAEFLARMGVARAHRSIDVAGCHVVFLDSMELTGDRQYFRGYVGEEQLAWLRRDLDAVPAGMPTVLITHMPLLSAMFQATVGALAAPPARRFVENNLEVLEVLQGRNVPLVLQGHLHVNEMIRWGATTFITAGAVCGKWWRGSWFGTPEGFGMLTLGGGRVDWEYQTYGWTAERP